MRYNVGGQEDLADFVTVPAGTYLCKVAEVRTGMTRHGDERWAFRLVVAEGEYVGRFAAWDGLVFSERAKPRLRKILRAFGLPCEGEVDLEPDQLEDKCAFVQIEASEFQDPASGEVSRRNQVPYNGFLETAPERECLPCVPSSRASNRSWPSSPLSPPGGSPLCCRDLEYRSLSYFGLEQGNQDERKTRFPVGVLVSIH